MNDAARLLRMLEPAVRPGGLPAPQRPATLPIEQRSFQSLLEEARQLRGAGEVVGKTDGDRATDDPGASEYLSTGLAAAGAPERVQPPIVSQLASLDRIENASSRQLMAGQSGPSNRPESSDL